MNKYTILLLFSLCAPVFADDISLLINGVSKHSRKGFNEQNTGIGIQYEFDSKSKYIPFATANVLKDSLNETSTMAGYGYVRRFKGRKLHLDIGAVGFVMTRKSYNDGRPFVGALPVASIGTDRIAVNITYIPAFEDNIIPAWFFQLKIPLR